MPTSSDLNVAATKERTGSRRRVRQQVADPTNPANQEKTLSQLNELGDDLADDLDSWDSRMAKNNAPALKPAPFWDGPAIAAALTGAMLGVLIGVPLGQYLHSVM